MSKFGATLFSGSRFIFWTLAPVLVLFALAFPYWIIGSGTTTIAVDISVELLTLLLILTLFNPARFWWAARGVAFIVFCFFGVYVTEKIRRAGTGSRVSIGSFGSSLKNAVLGFITIGLPCLWYSILGRWRLSVREDSIAANVDDKIDTMGIGNR